MLVNTCKVKVEMLDEGIYIEVLRIHHRFLWGREAENLKI